MTNCFGLDLHPKEVRWAAAESVSEDVIAAVLLLHERSVDEITPQLSAPELEQVINLVDRNPRLYPPGIGWEREFARYFSRSGKGAMGAMTPCCKPKYRSSMSEDTPSFDLML